MIGHARPLVKGDRLRATQVWTHALLLSGLIGGASLIAMAASLMGLPVRVAWSTSVRESVFVSASALLLLFDGHAALRNRTLACPVRRQTPKSIRERLPSGAVAVIWGLDIGSGVTTYRVTSGSYVLLVGIALLGWPVWLGSICGGSLAISILGSSITGRSSDPIALIRAVSSHRQQIQISYLYVLCVTLALILLGGRW